MQKNGLPVYEAEPGGLARIAAPTGLARAGALSPDDKRHHDWVMQQTAAIPELQEEMQRLGVRCTQLQAVRAAWVDYLREAYQLMEGDTIDAEGQLGLKQIRRHTVPAEPEPEPVAPPHPAEQAAAVDEDA